MRLIPSKRQSARAGRTRSALGANFSDVWDSLEGNRAFLKDNAASLHADHSQGYGGVSCFPGAFVVVWVSVLLLKHFPPVASKYATGIVAGRALTGSFSSKSRSVEALRAAPSAAANDRRNRRTIFSYRNVHRQPHLELRYSKQKKKLSQASRYRTFQDVSVWTPRVGQSRWIFV